jgi:hypothetical protein
MPVILTTQEAEIRIGEQAVLLSQSAVITDGTTTPGPTHVFLILGLHHT